MKYLKINDSNKIVKFYQKIRELIFVSHILTDVTASTVACAHYDHLFPALNCLCEHMDTFTSWQQGNRSQVSTDEL